MPQPDAATLTRWGRRWRALRLAAYADLVASYTPEQQAMARRMYAAGAQERLCKERAAWPEGASGKRATLVVWPDEPPAFEWPLTRREANSVAAAIRRAGGQAEVREEGRRIFVDAALGGRSVVISSIEQWEEMTG